MIGHRHRRRTATSVTICVFTLAATLFAAEATVFATAAPAAAERATNRPSGNVSWLAAGDSYSSGEGIARTGVGADTCAQSPIAYGPKAADILRTQREWVVKPLAFVACTGATLHEYYGGGADSNNGDGPQWRQALAQRPTKDRFDVITMSFGGNDIGFTSILEGCLDVSLVADSWTDILLKKPIGDAPCDVTYDDIAERVDNLLAGDSFDKPGTHYGQNGKLTLADFYADVANRNLTSRGVLVVVGYPRLFAPTEQWGGWRNGRCNLITSTDAELLGRAAEHLDQALSAAVAQAQGTITNGSVVYVSRFDLFHRDSVSHELCSGQTEYLNGVTAGFWDGSLRPMHSFHPNEVGHQVTAESVAGVAAHILEPPPPPPTQVAAPTPAAVRTTAPPISDGTSHWNVGDPFSSRCVVAWPTAPVRTTQYIQMRMSCTGVPQQYLFVDVIYLDPNLPVTPSTGQMTVEGTIIDLATSEFGFRTLVVQASRVILPS